MADDLILNPKLSICISTYNRGDYIVETLDTIVGQLDDRVELLILDGASPDNTAEVMSEYLERFPSIRYYRESINSGVDADYDKAVSLARGEFCWLMTDDDFVVAGAIERILCELVDGIDLVVLNACVKNASMTKVLDASHYKNCSEVYFGRDSIEDFFSSAIQALSFIGCVIVRRDFWLARDRESYYGSLFVHVGVIFQNPLPRGVKVIDAALVTIRFGNAMWTSRGFEIWMFKWPSLIWSFEFFSDEAKLSVSVREPWRNIKLLALYRALGGYGRVEYLNFVRPKLNFPFGFVFFLVAIFPAKLMNSLISISCIFRKNNSRMGIYSLLKSENATWISRLSARILGVGDNL